jgi:mannose-6-phosphate isomerase-like protein (cupin superfamily)
MTFGTTIGKPWIEALPTERGAQFTGRTFSRFHLIGTGSAVPSVCEIWATSDHALEPHAHDSDELLYVLSGVIEINGQRLGANDVVYIPGGTPYGARVVSEAGSHVVRVELPKAERHAGGPEYDARVWRGPLTGEGTPNLSAANEGDPLSTRGET